MKSNSLFGMRRIAFCASSLLFSLPALAAPLVLHYATPAEWEVDRTSNEAIPVGNGKLAAMLYGGVSTERIQFNEDTIWAGQPNDYAHAGAVDYLETIRDYIWAGQGQAAWNTAVKDNFMSVPLRQSPYQPAGELVLSFPHTGAVSEYRRSLDLDTATAAVDYVHGEVAYRRELIASYPDAILALYLSADTVGSLSFSGTFNTPHTRSSMTVDGPDLVLNAQVNVDIDSRRQQVSDIEFQARCRVRVNGGTVSVSGTRFTVEGADSAVLYLAVASNFVSYDDLSGDPDVRAHATVSAADAKGWEAIRADQLADYQELFNRVTVDLGDNGQSALATDVRLDNLKAAFKSFKDAYGWGDPDAFRDHFAGTDPQLLALNFQMARYLMISGSRPGSQPLTLQGKWNNEVNPSWESKMTLNINQEMNYWLAEVANLAECHVPMVDLVRDLSETGQSVAEKHYGASGWMVHHNTDLWRAAAPINNPGGVWPTGGAWLSMHLWWHYEYSRDLIYLQEVYPLMKGAAQFFVDFLVEDPREGNEPWLLTNPTHSPEHPNPELDDNGELVAGTTMDSQLIRSLFGYVIEASELLGMDADFRAEISAMRDRLPPNQIGQYGQIQEWLEDVDRPENPAIGGHRHLSHLVDLFPGEGIHPSFEADLAAACEVVLDWKGDPSNNTAWSRAWKMTLRNALFQGDHAYMILTDVLANSHTDNLTFSNKGNENQIDGNLGVAMGFTQFFLQNRRGEIHLLPALPGQIPNGSISGLRCFGGHTVDMVWANGELADAILHANHTETVIIRSPRALNVTRTDTNEPVLLASSGSERYQFDVEAGGTYRLIENTAAWAGYPVSNPEMDVFTESFLNWVNIQAAPWIWVYPISSWVYLPEENISESGAWMYVQR
jgi:alpha-L-fucosidase 2